MPDARAVQVDAGDAAGVPWPAVLRSRRPGDRFSPDRGGGSKKLKAWLIDRKVPQERRDGLVVLATGTRVLAIPELGAVAKGLGPSGARLSVSVLDGRRALPPPCKRGGGLL
jgi:tRNA(Ile)-lysidine synthase